MRTAAARRGATARGRRCRPIAARRHHMLRTPPRPRRGPSTSRPCRAMTRFRRSRTHRGRRRRPSTTGTRPIARRSSRRVTRAAGPRRSRRWAPRSPQHAWRLPTLRGRRRRRVGRPRREQSRRRRRRRERHVLVGVVAGRRRHGEARDEVRADGRQRRRVGVPAAEGPEAVRRVLARRERLERAAHAAVALDVAAPGVVRLDHRRAGQRDAHERRQAPAPLPVEEDVGPGHEDLPHELVLRVLDGHQGLVEALQPRRALRRFSRLLQSRHIHAVEPDREAPP